MSSLTRVYVSSDGISNSAAVITGGDAQHLIKVMRLRVGDSLSVCDGNANEYQSVITAIARDSVTVSLGAMIRLDTEPACPIVLYQCLPKSDKMDSIVQKSVELGVTQIVPVMSDRCISRPDDKTLCNKLERWQHIADAAASQSGRGILPKVTGLISYKDACNDAKQMIGMLCYEGEGTMQIQDVLKGVNQSSASGFAFIVGPEGGITEAEAELAKASGLALCGLGKRILRTETASSFVLSAIEVLTHW